MRFVGVLVFLAPGNPALQQLVECVAVHNSCVLSKDPYRLDENHDLPKTITVFLSSPVSQFVQHLTNLSVDI